MANSFAKIGVCRSRGVFTQASFKEGENMPGGKRPGGLTALAVLNFVFGGLGALGMLLSIGALMLAAKAADTLSDGQAQLSSAPGMGMIYLWIALGVVQVILMIASGVGYLKL